MSKTVSGKIVAIGNAVINGNSVYFFKVKYRDRYGKTIEALFEANITVSPYLSLATPGHFVQLTVGEEDLQTAKVITFKLYFPGEGCPVSDIKS